MSITLNKTYENTIIDCALVKQDLVQTTYDDQVGERIISWLAHSQIVNKPDVPTYLRYLDAKLSAVRKTATFWDAYNIRESASSSDEFIQKYASLPNNSSLIINASDFEINNQIYGHGDVIIKNFYGEQVIVKGEQTGVYMPTEATVENNNVVLNFTYKASGFPTETKVAFDSQLQPNDGAIYAYNFTSKIFSRFSNSIRIPAVVDVNGNVMMPFWECREMREDSKLGEKINDLIKATYIYDEDQETSDDDYHGEWEFTTQTTLIEFALIIK